MGGRNENIMNHPHQLSLRVSGSHANADSGGGDLIVGAGPGGGPHVKALDGGDVSAHGSAFNGRFLTADDLAREQGRAAGGVSEGESGLVYSGESGGMAGTGQFPYQVSLRSEPSSGDVGGDGRDDLIVGAGPAGGHVKVFDGGSADVELPDLLVTSWQNPAAAHGLNDYALITDFNTSLSPGTADLVFG